MPIQAKVFKHEPTLFKNASKALTNARDQALGFVNQKLEPEQIITVTESIGFGIPCTVTVWYKE